MLRNILLIAIAVVTYASQAYADGIVFHDITLPEAQAKAKEEGKLVFVDCYTPWCGPCKRMARDIFPLDSCGQFMNPRFVSIMKDLAAEENVPIAEKYGVKIYPTFLIIRPDGTFLRIEGGAVKTAGKFIERVGNALHLGECELRYQAGERSGEFIVEYANAIGTRSPQQLTELLDSYIPTLAVADLTSATSQELIGLIPSTDCAAFRYVFDNRAQLASALGAPGATDLVVGAYRREFASKRMNPGFDFSARLADLSQLAKESGEIDKFLYESMLFRDVINKKDTARIGDIVAAIATIGNFDGPESAKLDALSSLRGYTRAFSASDSEPVTTALGKVARNMTENARRSVENMR
ncbi:MAG: thioredoxin family protein [Duncaniella sp.]|nr:thioredoxin family protein [Duncaniella sp.]